MDSYQLEHFPECIQGIKVMNKPNEDVEVVNETDFWMIGKGRQGAVFHWDENICFKIFGNEEDCEREYYALSLGQHTNLFPKVYKKGPLFIVMEKISGVDLREYLQSQPLTPGLSWHLIQMLYTFKEIGFERIDHHKRQIYVQEDGSLKVIDVARTVWRDRVYPYPRKLLTSLGEENKQIFLTHVQEMAPDLHDEWLYYIQMEELSRKIYPILLPDSSDKKALKKMSKTLMTTNEEQTHYRMLEGLMHKVFKEEWVKVMLARGVDVEKVMEKIDQYWDRLEEKANRYEKKDKGTYHLKRKRYEGERVHRVRKLDHERDHHREHKRGKGKHRKKK